LYLGKEPSKLGLIASVLIGYSKLSFTRLVDYLLKLSILLLEYSGLVSKLLVLGLERVDLLFKLLESLIEVLLGRKLGSCGSSRGSYRS
jgi:hypothetical protein